MQTQIAMKKFLMTAMLVTGLASASFANDEGEEKVDNFDWLIEEIYGLENEEQDLDILENMVYIYDAEGNELASFKVDDYDTQPTEIKRSIQRGEFMFETLGDQVYMIN